ncbi:hypothetical protein LEN26_010351 [Aphanomyces euteiches]|nr:hypothetical protein AeMF1_009435 [Aphanomyces euteiches]KAH9122193.1 hypothetical protein LEN26_010351 [Aphanomyces euteiches]
MRRMSLLKKRDGVAPSNGDELRMDDQELSEGELARDFFVDCGTHTFPYGESYQMDPYLPSEEDVDAQREICDNVEDWANSLLETVDDLLAWKDQMVALHGLPTNAISGLVMLSSRFCRCKGQLQIALSKLLAMSHQLIGNLLLNSHILQFKTNMIDMSVAMDNEKMVLAEEQCKLRAALAQITRMKASHRFFRWCRLSSRLREKELRQEMEQQTSHFEAKRNEFHHVVKGQREQIQRLTEQVTNLQTFKSATDTLHTKIVLMPATQQVQAKAARLKSAPVRSVPFEKPLNPPPTPTDRKRDPKNPNDPPTKWSKRDQQQPPSNQSTDSTKPVVVEANRIVKPPATARPSTSGATPRRQRIPTEALDLKSPQDMSARQRESHYKEAWEERRAKQRVESEQKHLTSAKLEHPETNEATCFELDGDKVLVAGHANALVNSLGLRREKPKG